MIKKQTDDWLRLSIFGRRLAVIDHYHYHWHWPLLLRQLQAQLSVYLRRVSSDRVLAFCVGIKPFSDLQASILIRLAADYTGVL